MISIDVTNLASEQMDRTPSKGNQLKYHIGKLYFKLDCMGYEGLAEVLTSKILEKSNIDHFVKYDYASIVINGEPHSGCVSEEMKAPGEQLLSVEKYIQLEKGYSIGKKIGNIYDTREAIHFFIQELESTGVTGVGPYLTKLLGLDAFIFNQDRHMGNIALIKKDNSTKFSPVFDHGDSFFSDMIYFPKRFTTEELVKRTSAKPFCGSFIQQRNICEMMYGVKFNTAFNEDDLDLFCNEAIMYYSEEIIERVKGVVSYQLNKGE